MRVYVHTMLLAIYFLMSTPLVGYLNAVPSVDNILPPATRLEAQNTGAWWKSPEKPGTEALSDISYWEQQLFALCSAYPDSYQRNTSTVRQSALPALLYRDGIWAQLPTETDGFVVLTQADCRLFIERYYGPEVAAAVTLEDIHGNGFDRIEHDKIAFEPVRAMQYTGISSKQEILSVTPLDDNMDRVELVVNRYDTVSRYDDNRNLKEQTHAPSSVHRYTLYWEGTVGYVPENILWEYLPTNRVSLNGNIQAVPVLWGMEPSESLLQSLWHQPQLNISEPAMYKLRDLPSAYAMDPSSAPAYQPIYVFGENVYQLWLEGKTLYYDSINLETLEQQTDRILYSFEHVPQVLCQAGDSIIVLSDHVLYQFDTQMRLYQQIAYPKALPDAQWLIVNESVTKIAYCQNNSLYLLDLTPQAQPQLIYTYTRSEEDTMKVETLYPVRIINNERILVGVGGWDAIIKYFVFAPDCALIAEMPFYVSGELGGGYSFSNAAGILYSYFGDWQYYNFNTLQLKAADYIDFDYEGWYTSACRSPVDGQHVWYFSKMQGPDNQPDTTEFYQVDFESGRMIKLPVSVLGAKAKLMAVSKSGRMLFNYKYKNECGFAVYTPI